MPANVETAVYSNEPAWHREGIVLDSNGEKGLTIEQALPASGLDWEVTKVPAYGYTPDSFKLKDGKPDFGALKASAKPVRVADRFSVCRLSDGKMMGTVGKTWEPIQNVEGFALIDDLIQEAGGKCWIEAAGSLDGGKKVWVLAHLDTGLQIAGEDYREYLLFTNGHDGRSSVTAATTNVRVVCENTLALSLMPDTGGYTPPPRIVRVRHSKNASERIKEARQILQLRNQYTEELAKQGEWLVEKEMSDGDFDEFLEKLMPIQEDDTPAATMIEGRRMEVREIYNGSDNLAAIRGTKWGALQAVVEYADYKRPFKSADTKVKAQLGLTAQSVAIKDQAHTLLGMVDAGRL